jgi:predicted transcriptional regulator
MSVRFRPAGLIRSMFAMLRIDEPSRQRRPPRFQWVGNCDRIRTPSNGGSVNRFFRSNQPSLAQLGPLEQRLLQEIWTRGHGTVRELLQDGNLGIAYTTVMTTLDRLYKKNLLTRVAEGRAFRYLPCVTREEMQRAAAGQAIRQLLGSGSAASLPLSYLVEAVTEHDIQLLDELQELVERKRHALHKPETL